MEHSEQIDKIAPALVKMQGELKQAVFNKINPHYKTKYADYLSCREATREPLLNNGLCALQSAVTREGQLQLETTLLHESGQWMKSYLPLVPVKNDSQSIGSAVTYMKRYGLSAALGIVTGDEVDDDAEVADGRPENKPKDIQPSKKTTPAANKVEDIGLSKKLKSEIEALREKLSDKAKESFDTRVKKYCGSLEKATVAELQDILENMKGDKQHVA